MELAGSILVVVAAVIHIGNEMMKNRRESKQSKTPEPLESPPPKEEEQVSNLITDPDEVRRQWVDIRKSRPHEDIEPQLLEGTRATLRAVSLAVGTLGVALFLSGLFLD